MKSLSWDSETFPIAAGVLAPEMVCLTWCDDAFEPGILHAKLEAAQTEALLREWLESDIVLVGANVAYDALVTAKRFPALLGWIFSKYRRGQLIDVQHNQRLIDNARGELNGTYDRHGNWVKYYYSLDALHQRYGHGALVKDQNRLRYGTLIDIPCNEWETRGWVGARTYPLDDAAATHRVHGSQSVYADWIIDGPAQARAAFALHCMSDEGMRTDAKACADYIREIEQDLAQAEKLLRESGLLRASGTRNTKAAKERMAEVMARLGEEPKRTEKDGVCLDYEACRDSFDPLLQAYALYSGADSLRKRTKKLAIGATQKLQTAFEVLQRNGRTASKTPGHPLIGENLQNLPAFGKLRTCFVPEPGFFYSSVDYHQFELACFAQVEINFFGSSRIGDAINAGKDLHCMLAAALMRKDYEWVLANKKSPEVAPVRDLSKRVNFGKLGGMGVKRLMATVNAAAERPEDRITERRAKEASEAWLDTWATRPYFELVSRLTADGPCTIQQFVSGRVRGRVGYCDTANGFFSGLAADAIKACLLPMAEECYVDQASPLFGARPLLLIHDETLLEVPEVTAHEAAYRQRDIQVNIAQTYLPDVKVSAEPALMRRWYKNAVAVHDANGRLIPWEPAA